MSRKFKDDRKFYLNVGAHQNDRRLRGLSVEDAEREMRAASDWAKEHGMLCLLHLIEEVNDWRLDYDEPKRKFGWDEHACWGSRAPNPAGHFFYAGASLCGRHEWGWGSVEPSFVWYPRRFYRECARCRVALMNLPESHGAYRARQAYEHLQEERTGRSNSGPSTLLRR